MNANTAYSHVTRLLPVITGSVLVGSAFLLDSIVKESAPQLLQIVLIVAGCAFVVLGIALRRRQSSVVLAKASLAILSTTILIAFLEAAFRAIGFDFDRLHAPGDELPIYYRPPTFHAGDGIFRRPGPASWRGKPLSAYMRIRWGSEAAYPDEQPVEIQYDALGFRNPADLKDWEVVVTGDSSVELGFLPYDELFTTLAAKRLGIRIKNLGVCCSGPVSETFFVKNYGKAASTRDAVLCFFEGNDVTDLDREIRNTESFRATGRPFERRKQVSLLQAVSDQFKRFRTADGALLRATPNAVLVSGNQERPMTVYVMPPVWNRLSVIRQKRVVEALTTWSRTVRSMGMRPWVMYLPDSHRVFHGLIRYADTNSPLALWKPGEFAAHLGAICTNLDAGFINTFPALRREAETGGVPYNLIGDTHFSTNGSRIVADVLADALQSGRGH